MRYVFLLTFILVTLIGCATAHKMNNISLGMTKQQVVAILGFPASTSATSGVEYLNYRFSETDEHAFNGITTPYYVQIVDGSFPVRPVSAIHQPAACDFCEAEAARKVKIEMLLVNGVV